MTQMPDEKVRQVFQNANKKLCNFYFEKMSTDWVKHISEEKENLEFPLTDPSAMTHLSSRVESDMNAVDISGRTT